MGFCVKSSKSGSYAVVLEDNAGGKAVVATFPPNEEVEAGVCVKRLSLIVAQELKMVPAAVEGAAN